MRNFVGLDTCLLQRRSAVVRWRKIRNLYKCGESTDHDLHLFSNRCVCFSSDLCLNSMKVKIQTVCESANEEARIFYFVSCKQNKFSCTLLEAILLNLNNLYIDCCGHLGKTAELFWAVAVLHAVGFVYCVNIYCLPLTLSI